MVIFPTETFITRFSATFKTVHKFIHTRYLSYALLFEVKCTWHSLIGDSGPNLLLLNLELVQSGGFRYNFSF